MTEEPEPTPEEIEHELATLEEGEESEEETEDEVPEEETPDPEE